MLLADAVPGEDFILVLGDVRDMHPAAVSRAIKGLIVANGSPFDHIGIVTREYGIPAIFGATNAPQVIHNGDTVELDGKSGIARVVSRAPQAPATRLSHQQYRALEPNGMGTVLK